MGLEVAAKGALLVGEVGHAIDDDETRPDILVETLHHLAQGSTGRGADFQVWPRQLLVPQQFNEEGQFFL